MPKRKEENEKILSSGSKKAKIDSSIKMNSKQAVKQLKEILENVQSTGEYSVSGEATELPNLPNIHIKNVGPISFPLAESQANEIITVCAQAPFGRNQFTLIDTNVRDSYQLDPSQIEINHPNWKSQLNALVQRVAKEMGCLNKNVSAKLYKMLLYKKGGHFLKHRDTEKEKNMFATLVIQLPSIYTGGEFIVYNGAHLKKYDFGVSTGKAPIAMHFTAHYADLEHEIKPLKSGYRSALVYSLCSNDIINLNLSKPERLSHLTNALNNLATFGKPLAIALDHQYTHGSISNNGISALKGIDADRFSLLNSASMSFSDENKFFFYIVKATLESQQMIEEYDDYPYEDYGREYDDEDEDDDDDEDDEVNNGNGERVLPQDFLTAEQEEEIPLEDEYGYQKTKKLDRWYDIEGNHDLEKFSDISFDFFPKIFDLTNGSTNKINSWIFKDSNEEYTGNEGNSRTTIYNKYLIAFWSKRSEFSIMAGISTEEAIQSIIDDSSLKTKTENLEKLLNMMIAEGLESDEDELDEEDDSDADESKQERKYLFSNLNNNCYAQITSLVISVNKPNLTNLYADIIGGEKSASVQTDTFYKLWKARLLDISQFKFILIDLVKNKKNKGIKDLNQSIEMVKELRDLDLIKLIIKKAINLYTDSSLSSNYLSQQNYKGYLFQPKINDQDTDQDKLAYLKKAIELIQIYEPQSFTQIFESFSSVKNGSIQEYCTLAQGLVSLKQNEMALVCMEKYILPMLAISTDLNANCYTDISHLVIHFNKSTLAKLYTEIISNLKSLSIRTDSIFKIWKARLLDISEFRFILNDIVKKDNNEGIENFNKQLEMVKELKDVEFIKLFIKKAVLSYTNSNDVVYLQIAIELIVTYKLQSLTKSFFESFIPVSNKNIQSYCNLAQWLLSLKQHEMASIFIVKYVLPILDPIEFIMLRDTGNNKAYYKIYETLFMFNRENDLIKFKDLVITKFNQDQLAELLKNFIEENKMARIKLNTSKPIRDLFLCRLNYFEDKLKQHELSISWVMKGSIPGHREVEAFLKSDEQIMIYRGSGMPSGSFSSKTPADRFVLNFSGVKMDYSVRMNVVKNRGEKHHIVISKTMEYVQSVKASKKIKIINDIKYLKSFFN